MKTLDDLFNEQESTLARRARERREREEAWSITPEGQAFLKREQERRERDAERFEAEDAAFEADEMDDEDDGEA